MENNMKKFVDIQKSKGIKTEEIIKNSEIGRTSFFEILRCNQIPKVDTAAKIAKALNADAYEIFPILKGGNND